MSSLGLTGPPASSRDLPRSPLTSGALRRYVHSQLGQSDNVATDDAAARGKKRVRGESGQRITEQANLYEAWQKSSKRRIQAPGESEGPEAADGSDARKRVAKGGKRWHTATRSLPNAGGSGEVKMGQQIAKARNARRQEGWRWQG